MKKIILYLFLALSAQLPAQVQMFFEPDTYSGVENPHDIDSLFYWFAADIGVLDSVGSPIANDDGVGTWPDLSGNGRNTTQGTTANRPTWKLNGGPNNRPSVSFDGVDDILSSSAHFWGSDDITIFAVVKMESATANRAEFIISRTSAGTNRQWEFRGSGNSEFNRAQIKAHRSGGGSNANFRAFYSTDNWKHTDWGLTAASSNGAATYYFFKNGSDVTGVSITNGTGDGSIFDADEPVYIGNGAGSTLSISEIIVYSRALTAGERESIEAYLNQKYKLY